MITHFASACFAVTSCPRSSGCVLQCPEAAGAGGGDLTRARPLEAGGGCLTPARRLLAPLSAHATSSVSALCVALCLTLCVQPFEVSGRAFITLSSCTVIFTFIVSFLFDVLFYRPPPGARGSCSSGLLLDCMAKTRLKSITHCACVRACVCMCVLLTIGPASHQLEALIDRIAFDLDVKPPVCP